MSREMSRDKSHSARDIDVQPATIDVSDEDTGKLEKTPSHSLPAVTLAGAGSGRPVQASRSPEGGGTADGMDAPGFVDVDDIAMHVDRDPNRWHDTVRVSPRVFSCWTLKYSYLTEEHTSLNPFDANCSKLLLFEGSSTILV